MSIPLVEGVGLTEEESLVVATGEELLVETARLNEEELLVEATGLNEEDTVRHYDENMNKEKKREREKRRGERWEKRSKNNKVPD
jgi:hypothetical protein